MTYQLSFLLHHWCKGKLSPSTYKALFSGTFLLRIRARPKISEAALKVKYSSERSLNVSE